MSCSIITIVTSRGMLVTSLSTSRRSSIESPAKGSSRSRTLGFWASAIATSTRRRSPYEVWASGRSAI